MTKRRTLSALALGGGLSALVLLAACGAGDDELVAPPGGGGGTPVQPSTWKYAPNAVEADDDIVNAIEVREDSLVLPRSFEGRSFEVGKVLFGRWAEGFPERNPYGFMRHIEAVAVEGESLVLRTRQASLSDVFEEADIHFDSTTIPGNEAAPQAGSLNLLQNGSGPQPPARTGGATAISFSPTFGFDSAGGSYTPPGGGTATSRAQSSVTFDVYLHPQVSLDFSSSWWSGTKLNVDYRVPYEFGMKTCAALQGNYAWAADPSNSYQFDRIPPIPLGTPLNLMLAVTVGVACFPQVGGTVQIESNQSVFGEPSTQYGYDGGWYKRSPDPQVGSRRDLTVILNGTGGPRCQLELRVGVYAMGMVGAYLQYVPGVELNVTGSGRYSSANDELEGQVCLKSQLTQRADIGVGASVWGIKLADYSQTIWNGKNIVFADTCRERNDCTGKQPGWYCSDQPLQENFAYECLPGSGGGDAGAGSTRGGGFTCPDDSYCQLAGDGRRAAMEGNYPKCGPDKAPASNAHLDGLTCVEQRFPGFSVDQ